MTTREEIEDLLDIVANGISATPYIGRDCDTAFNAMPKLRAAYDALARERDLAVGRLQATEVQFYALRLELADSAIALKAAKRERDALQEQLNELKNEQIQQLPET